MMILNQNNVKLVNEDTTYRRNPDLTSGIYLTTVKLAQCRHVADNRRENEETKNLTAKKTSIRKVHLKLKISEAFDRCINSMNSIYSSTTNE